MNDMIDVLGEMILTREVVRGNLSRAWRKICHGRKARRGTAREYRRRDRRAIRLTLSTGARFAPKMYTTRTVY